MTRLAVGFRVTGKPQPGGSKRGFAIRRKDGPTGRIAVVDDNPRAKDWKALVIAVAMDEVDARNGFPLTGPLGVEITFMLTRPKGHFGTGANAIHIRKSAPTYPTVRPDVSKLARPTIDALSGIVWRDDAQIVHESHRKVYEDPPGAYINVWELTP